MLRRTMTVVAGGVLAAGLATLAFSGAASASRLDVDGGVVQQWQLPADVQHLVTENGGSPPGPLDL